MRDAIVIAMAIEAGALDLYEGSRRIWFECQLHLTPGDHRLDPFVYWASEHDDADAARKSLCEQGLRTAVSSLLERGNAL